MTLDLGSAILGQKFDTTAIYFVNILGTPELTKCLQWLLVLRLLRADKAWYFRLYYDRDL